MTTTSSVGTVAALLILRRPEINGADGTANAADTILKTASKAAKSSLPALTLSDRLE